MHSIVDTMRAWKVLVGVIGVLLVFGFIASTTPPPPSTVVLLGNAFTHTEAAGVVVEASFSNSTWFPHATRASPQKQYCPKDVHVWVPCKDQKQCEVKKTFSFPCRTSTFYDEDVWDFCNPMARLNKSVYTLNPPLHVRNRTVSDSDVWRTISLPLRDAWRAVQYPSLTASSSTTNDTCSGARPSQAIVGFAASPMRPFQVIALVRTAYEAMHDGKTIRMHLFVTNAEDPLLLYLRASTTHGLHADDMTPQELLQASRSGRMNDSFLVLEAYGEYAARIRGMSGNNRRVEVVRVNVARWWLRYGAGRCYHQLLFVDTRDAVFTSNVFDALDASLASSLVAPNEEHIFAATEEFPFFRQPRMGMQWNVEVHTTTYGPDMMFMMQRFHLDDYPYMRLINSGVYGGTYTALLDLFEVWGASTAAVFTETFGVDQPLLGGLMYFGLRLTQYPHRVLLLSGSDGPLRHLYTDGGTVPNYPFMRLVLASGERILSRHLPPYVADNKTTIAPIRQVNCVGDTYALIHQADRYSQMWLWLTEPPSATAIAWAKLHGVEWTWGKRQEKVKGRRRHG